VKTRYDELKEQCVAFHEAHPQVWELFVRFTFDRISMGFKNYSSDAIFHRIRWETDQADVDGRSTFKMNDHYTAFYARAFMRKYPQYNGFFRLRNQKSENQPATNLPPLGPADFPEVRL
jgi:hypothetical protein